MTDIPPRTELDPEGDWWVARNIDVDVASQGETVEVALTNLAEAVALYLEEAENPQVLQSSTVEVEAQRFTHVRTKGCHAVYRNACGRIVIIPTHRTVRPGVFASILRQADASASDFVKLLG